MSENKSLQITIVITLGVIILALIGYNLAKDRFNQGEDEITVIGESSIKVNPDMVAVYFNIETNGSTAEEAKNKNAEIADKVITALLKKGFERKEIQTQNFNIYPKYYWDKDGKRIQDGYIATHSMRITFETKNTEKIGQVIDAGIDNGANLNYINFELSEKLQEEYKKQAISLASKNAKVKAEASTEGIGKKLGEVVKITIDEYHYSPWRGYELFSAGMDKAEIVKETTNIQPSEQEVTARVSVTFKIK